jgi:hypothetical protein
LKTRELRKFHEPVLDALGEQPELPLCFDRPLGLRPWCTWRRCTQMRIDRRAVYGRAPGAVRSELSEPMESYGSVTLCYGAIERSRHCGYHCVVLLNEADPRDDVLLYASRSGLNAARRWRQACELLDLPREEYGDPRSRFADADLDPVALYCAESSYQSLTDAVETDKMAVFETRLAQNEAPRFSRFPRRLLGWVCLGAAVVLVALNLGLVAGAAVGTWLALHLVHWLWVRLTARQVLGVSGAGVELEHRFAGRSLFSCTIPVDEVCSVNVWRSGLIGWAVFVRSRDDRVLFGPRLSREQAEYVCGVVRKCLPGVDVIPPPEPAPDAPGEKAGAEP